MFHCYEDSSFNREDQFVRAFIYKDYSFQPHIHDFYEINVVIGGKGIHEIESSSISVEIGDVFVIPPKISHAWYNTDSLDVCHIMIKEEFIRQNQKESRNVAGYLQFMEIEPFLRQNNSEAMFLHLDASQLSELQHELIFLEDGGIFDQKCYATIQSHTVWKVIYYLSYLFDKQNNDYRESKKKKYNVSILDTIEYLHQHYPERITIEQLAKRVFLSRSTFLRNFQSICGCSPLQYLNRYRVEKAKELLENTTQPKTEIAHSCGFYDLSHMDRAIKSMGISITIRK